MMGDKTDPGAPTPVPRGKLPLDAATALPQLGSVLPDVQAMLDQNGYLGLLLIDFEQNSLIRFVQGSWQFIQGTPNARWKTAPQSIQLTDNPSEPAPCREPS